MDRIVADLVKRYPDMDEYERKHLEAVKALWKNRLKKVTGRKVADKIEEATDPEAFLMSRRHPVPHLTVPHPTPWSVR